MPSLAAFRLRFTLNWRLFCLALMIIALFSRMGFWQLERAYEKKAIQKAAALRAQEKPQIWNSNASQPLPYQRITLKGQYLAKTLLLDNQHLNHQFGFDVLSPLQLDNNAIVIIDRGFIPVNNRYKLPAISSPKGELLLSGMAYYPSQKKIILGAQYEKTKAQLSIVETLDTEILSSILHKPVYPFIIRLDPAEPYGFLRAWPLIAMPVERHYAYALQWFLMAFMLFILLCSKSLKKKARK